VAFPALGIYFQLEPWRKKRGSDEGDGLKKIATELNSTLKEDKKRKR
jgi:hypothetical protein